MLCVKNLIKTYQTKGSSEVKALDGVSIDFPETGMVFILGKSGSGKSTLLNILGGIDEPSGGELILDGRSCKTFSEKELNAYRNESVGFVFQDYNLIDTYTVAQNIAIALELQGRKAQKSEIDELLKKLNLQDDSGITFYDRKVNELSGGQKQRVAIARALVKGSQMILADEPTGALDYATGQELYGILKQLSQDRLVIVVTHDEESAKMYGDRIIELKDGQIIHDNWQQNALENTGYPSEKQREDIKKSRLPFGRAVTMGASAIKAKPFRLIVMMIVALVSFVIFGFSFTALSIDGFSCELRTTSEKGYNVVSVYKTAGFSESELNMIRENTGFEPHRVIKSYDEIIDINFDNVYGMHRKDLYLKRNPYVNFASGDPSIFVEVDPDTGADELRLRPDERFADDAHCRLPETYDEIAITDICADMFIRYGYKNTDGVVTEISSPDDLIGVDIGGYKITGVYSTEQSADYFRRYDVDNFGLTPQQIAEYDRDGVITTNEESDYEWYCSRYSSYDTIISSSFVRTGLFEHKLRKTTIKNLMFRLSGDAGKNVELIKTLSLNTDDSGNRFELYTPVSHFVARASFFFQFVVIAMIISAVFAVFSILLMMNYFSVSMDYRRHELGVLRALGAGKKELALICLSESLILASVLFAISTIGVITLCAVINGIFMISLYFFGIVPLAMLFFVCFGSCALSTLIPVLRLNKKKPIDIIYDEK